MDGKFTHKSILVAGGHKAAPPLSITYSVVVTREIVRLVFLIAGLINIFACDISNSYLNVPCQEKLWTKSGS